MWTLINQDFSTKTEEQLLNFPFSRKCDDLLSFRSIRLYRNFHRMDGYDGRAGRAGNKRTRTDAIVRQQANLKQTQYQSGQTQRPKSTRRFSNILKKGTIRFLNISDQRELSQRPHQGQNFTSVRVFLRLAVLRP